MGPTEVLILLASLQEILAVADVLLLGGLSTLL